MIRRIAYALLAFLLLLFLLGAASGAAPVPSESDIGAWFKLTVGAFTGAKYLLAVYGIVMLLTQGFKVLVEKVKPAWLPTSAIPWISSGLGMLSTTLAALYAGVDIVNALVAGIVVGHAASGFWSMVGKYILKKKGEKS